MIELTNIGVAYDARTILDGVNATISDGGITALMGPNGCGKTTMLRCIGGLQTPTRGSVRVDGKRVEDYSARELAKRVAFVRQHAQTDFDFSAFEIVLMGRNPYQHRLQNESQSDWDIVERCMRQTGTWDLRFARPHEMSGGELQRVMIARALAQSTPLLLMDEPVSNLDIAHQLEIMRLLRSLGKTVVIVLHDLNLALHFCDRLMLLHNGRLLYHGPIDNGLTSQQIETVYGVATHRENNHIVFDY